MLERLSRDESFRYSQLLSNVMDRYRPIPELMARHPALHNALANPNNQATLLQANKVMKTMANIVDSSDVYLMDTTGLTIAASNYQLDASFVGGDFSFRPYFKEAMAHRDSALYFALGTTSLERGLYFSHPVMPSDPVADPLGVLVVKILVTDLEDAWLRPKNFIDSEMVVQDAEGVGFLTSRPEWLYHSFEPLTAPTRQRIIDSQRYYQQRIDSVPILDQQQPPGVSNGVQRLVVRNSGTAETYLSVVTPLPRLDWDLRVLADTAAVRSVQLRFLAGGMILAFGLILAGLYLRERFRREAELAERGEQLEHRVVERTADLEDSNRKLMGVIREKERAQHELEEAQRELIQAAKLAVLGQMSAGLNHEMNQPLTAIHAYARNSEQFLARGEETTVRENLQEIRRLCRRMSDLTRQFKVFARKSEGNPTTVDLRQPIAAALKLVQAQAHDARVTIDWTAPAEPLWVHGDLIRIEQVLVNLLTNALQATSDTQAPHIRISTEQAGEWLHCHVIDNGPGLPADTEQLFEPFYTTKSMHQGLGLGLSISRQIVDALGGHLLGRNRRDRTPGAEFVLELPLRSAPIDTPQSPGGPE